MKFNPVVKYYQILVERGSISEDDIPHDIKELMNDKEEDDIPNSNIEEDINPLSFKRASIKIPKIKFKVSNIDSIMNSSIDILVPYDDILGSIEGIDVYPSGVNCSIILVENTYGKFKEDPTCTISTENIGIHINISGELQKDIDVGENFLRIDINMQSSNYEDSRFTIYLNK